MEKTPPALLDRLIAVARDHKMTPAEMQAQRVSFVYGQMRGSLTKDEIWERLADRFGWERSVDEQIAGLEVSDARI